MDTEPTTLRVTIDCGGMAAPQGADNNDTLLIRNAVRQAFVDPDPGDVEVVVEFANTQPQSTLTGPWVAARVFDESDHWTIDFLDAQGNYSEFVWDHFIDPGEALLTIEERPGNFNTMRQALRRVPEFIAHHAATDTVTRIIIVGVLPPEEPSLPLRDVRLDRLPNGHEWEIFAPGQPPGVLPLKNAINYVCHNFQPIECPYCGHDDQLQVLADATHSWVVKVEDGKLINETGYEDTDAPTRNERMFCGSCGNEFPMFEHVKAEYK